MAIGRIIDVSSQNHKDLPPGQGPPIDWATVKAAGVEAVFIKATQDTTYTNRWFWTDLLEAEHAKILVCAYHFAGMSDPVAEARHFMQVAGPYARMLDYETNTNVAWARTFLQELATPPQELITYGSLDTLKDFYAQLPSMAFPAAYNQGWPGFGVCWQFTDAAKIPGIVGDVDEDQWRGDETQFETLFSVVPPIEEDDMKPLYATNVAGTGFVIATDLSSKTGIPDAADAQALLNTGQYQVVHLTDQLINIIPNAH